MRTLATVIAIILLASLVLNGYLLWDRAKSEKDKILVNREWQQKIDDHKATIDRAGDRIAQLHTRRVNDSLFFRSREKGLKIDLDRYKAKASQIRPTVQAKIDSFTDLRQYVELQDSIIVKQDSLIRAQDLFCALQVRDLQEIINLHTSKFQSQTAISDAWRETAIAGQADLKKEKRKGRFWKVTSGILAGGILFMAARD